MNKSKKKPGLAHSIQTISTFANNYLLQHRWKEMIKSFVMIYSQSPADDARNLIGRYALAALGAIESYL